MTVVTATLTTNVCLSKLPLPALLTPFDDTAKTEHQWLCSSARSAILPKMCGRLAEGKQLLLYVKDGAVL